MSTLFGLSKYHLPTNNSSLGNLIGPPFAGWLYDYSKEWFLTFGLCGLFIGMIGSSYLLIMISNILFFSDLRNVSSNYSRNNVHQKIIFQVIQS